MGQEYFINSQKLEDKIRQSLPSQGGAGAGFDLSASTQIIPIIDLTESSEGSILRQDLQSSISFDNATAFAVNNASSTLINTTGYWRVFGAYSVFESGGSVTTDSFQINDGSTDKIILAFKRFGSGTAKSAYESFDFIVKLGAGDSLSATSSNALCFFNGCTRQIANIAGELS